MLNEKLISPQLDNKREDSITSQFQSQGRRGSVYIVGDFFVNPIRESTTKNESNTDLEENNAQEPTRESDKNESNIFYIFYIHSIHS